MSNLLPNQNQDDSRPQFDGSAGINAVSGTKENRANKLMFAAFAGIVFLCVVGYVLYRLWSSHQPAPEETPKDDGTIITSSRSITLPPLSELNKRDEPPTPEPAPAPTPVPAASTALPPIATVFNFKEFPMPKTAEEPKEPAEAPKPVQMPELKTIPAIVKENVLPDSASNKTEEKKEKEVGPSLDERRFAAPLMNGSTAPQSRPPVESSDAFGEGGEKDSDSKLSGLLQSVDTPRARANRMANRSMLIPKGTFIDCVLETKLDTTVPGMTSCVVPRAVWSANGKVLLVERGSKVIGEYKGSVGNGLNRIFVLWTQLQTPHGVRIPLDSPGTDELGGSGLNGYVDFHWWKRFGNALLFSLIQDGFDYAIQRQSDSSGGVNYYQNSQDGMQEIIREAMRQTGNIPPTLIKNQGERIGIFVGRDLDFSSVYDLRIKD